MTDKQIIEEALKSLSKYDANKMKNEIANAIQLKKHNKSIISIINKYKNAQTSQIIYKNYLYDICNQLKVVKKDFILLL
jgi:hypothetical protein